MHTSDRSAKPKSQPAAIDWARDLNAQQRAAVKSVDGPHLVIAGAGTGKTRTLVYRAAYLVSMGVHPGSILLLTFTNRAAREMLSRAVALLDSRCSAIAGGTFHSFANRVLRRYARHVGCEPSFTILDEGDSEDLIGRIRYQLGFADTNRRFPSKATVRAVLSTVANTEASLRDVLMSEEYVAFADLVPELEQIGESYTEAKRLRSLLDFDDLLLFLRDLLRDNQAVRQALSATYRYVMVDEYQDTNRLQAEIACLLAAAHGNMMVVGDDSQSIYSFRGADIGNILDFPSIFPSCTRITLEQNYRSTPQILALANAVISLAREGYPKQLFSESTGTLKPAYVRPYDEAEQAAFICGRILELREEGIPLHRMAVLTRVAHYSNEVQIEMGRRGIPYRVYGGRKFIEAAHVKDVLAYLRISENHRDDLAWDRALQILDGVGPKTADTIIGVVVDKNKGINGLSDAQFQGRAYTLALWRLRDTLARLREPSVDAATAMDVVLSFYLPLFERRYEDYVVRRPDLDSMLAMGQRYRSVESFLTDFTLEPHDRQEYDGRPPTDEQPVAISTIHSSKGLEWHAVFVIHVVSGCLPMACNPEARLEEERRLLYVAITRAQREFYLLAPLTLSRRPRGKWPMRTDGRPLVRPSEFIMELDTFSDLTEELAVTVGCGSPPEADSSPEAGGAADNRRLQNIIDYFRRGDRASSSTTHDNTA